MLVYRITVAKYANRLVASGRAARWNPNDVDMIYTASSRSLACLENVVHRTPAGLNQIFSVMTIEVPDDMVIADVNREELPVHWKEYGQMFYTQNIGEKWIGENSSAILKVPSSIIEEESNYLFNPKHPDFGKIKLIRSEPFSFDKRIKK